MLAMEGNKKTKQYGLDSATSWFGSCISSCSSSEKVSTHRKLPRTASESSVTNPMKKRGGWKAIIFILGIFLSSLAMFFFSTKLSYIYFSINEFQFSCIHTIKN